jgi:hypothetical protein
MFQKAVVLFLVSSVKFMFAFPLAVTFKFSFINTFIITTAGGITGVIIFAFLSQGLIAAWKWLLNKYVFPFPPVAKRLRFHTGDTAGRKSAVPVKRRRRYIWLRKSIGFWGIAVLTPFILSIPIGTFLIVRYYGRSVRNILFVCGLVVVWSAIFSTLIYVTEVTF